MRNPTRKAWLCRATPRSSPARSTSGTGPGENYPKQWVYQRSGMPVEIFEEWDTWRRIRGLPGRHRLGQRQSLDQQAHGDRDRDPAHPATTPPSETAPAVAELEPGVIGRIEECKDDWCKLEVSHKADEGWLKRTEIWGVNPTENFKE